MATLTEISGESVADKFLLGNSLFTGLKIGKIKTLFGDFTGSNVFSTLREYSTTSGYQVPSGKVFVMAFFKLVITGSGSSGSYQTFGSGTSDVGMAGSAPTGVDISSNSRAAYLQTASTAEVERTWIAKFKAGTYPCVFSSAGSGSVHVVGYEINESDASL